MLHVELSRGEWRPGEVVTARVRPGDPGAVSAIRLVVAEGGNGVDGALRRDGDQWVLETAVPYDAPVGTYALSFLSYGVGGAFLEASRTSFTVL